MSKNIATNRIMVMVVVKQKEEEKEEVYAACGSYSISVRAGRGGW